MEIDDFSRTVEYKFSKPLDESGISHVQSKLITLDGIKSFKIFPDKVQVELLTFKLAEESVKEIIEDMGYALKKEKIKRPGIFRRFIENLARSNKETFGDKRLECCNLKHQK